MGDLEVAQNIATNMLKNIDRICRENDIEYFIIAGTLLGAVRHGGFIPWDDDIDIAMTRENYNRFLRIAQKELGDKFFVQTSESDKYYDIFHVPLKIRDNNSRVISEKNAKYHSGVFIDVFPLDYLSNNNLLRKLERNLASIFSVSNTVIGSPFSGLGVMNKILYPIHYFNYKCLSFNVRRKIISSISKLTGRDKDIIAYGLDSIWKVEFKTKDIYPTIDMKFGDLTVMGPRNAHNVLVAEYGKNYMTPPPEDQRFPYHFKGVEIINEDKFNS